MLTKVILVLALVGFSCAQTIIRLNETTTFYMDAGMATKTATIAHPKYLWAAVYVTNYYAIANSGLQVYYSYKSFPLGTSNDTYFVERGNITNRYLYANASDGNEDSTMYLLFKRNAAATASPLRIDISATVRCQI
jgi:hypothetical protein